MTPSGRTPTSAHSTDAPHTAEGAAGTAAPDQVRRRRRPRRTCVGCRETREQHELIRVVRAADGAVVEDTERRAPGRGAYLCPDAQCWARALKSDALSRALRTRLRPGDQAALEARAAVLGATGNGTQAGSGDHGR